MRAKITHGKPFLEERMLLRSRHFHSVYMVIKTYPKTASAWPEDFIEVGYTKKFESAVL
ncbi:MAG: hypothetical protein ACREQ7_12745 [Candidatus Binatia bacterium]